MAKFRANAGRADPKIFVADGWVGRHRPEPRRTGTGGRSVGDAYTTVLLTSHRIFTGWGEIERERAGDRERATASLDKTRRNALRAKEGRSTRTRGEVTATAERNSESPTERLAAKYNCLEEL